MSISAFKMAFCKRWEDGTKIKGEKGRRWNEFNVEKEFENEMQRERKTSGKEERWRTHLKSSIKAMMKVLKLLCSLMALSRPSSSARFPNNYTTTRTE